MGLLVRWLVLTAAIIVASYLIQGIEVNGFFSAFFAAAILGVLNVFFRPILLILTLPINILTLGFFYVHHQCGSAQDGLGRYLRFCGTRILVSGFRRPDYQRGELAAEFVHQ